MQPSVTEAILVHLMKPYLSKCEEINMCIQNMVKAEIKNF